MAVAAMVGVMAPRNPPAGLLQYLVPFYCKETNMHGNKHARNPRPPTRAGEARSASRPEIMRARVLFVVLALGGGSCFSATPVLHPKAAGPVLHPHTAAGRNSFSRSSGPIVCSGSSGPQEQATTAAALLGLVSQPVMWWSLYTLKTTGCGLPGGPFGLIGAAEGISYLVVIGFVAAALLSKVTSGKGLPAGPGGLLGAAEGLSFLTAFAGLAVLGFQLADYGYVPEAVPIQGGVCTKQLSG